MLECVEESPMLHMFKLGERYQCSVVNGKILVHQGVFQMEVSNISLGYWKNNKESAIFREVA